MARGQKTGGRKHGSINKSTRERQINAAQVIDNARKNGEDPAINVLQRLMKLAEGATGLNRPTPERESQTGAPVNPDGNWTRFKEWFDRAAYCAKELAKYQSPQIRSIEISTPRPQADDVEPYSFTLKVFENERLVKSNERNQT